MVGQNKGDHKVWAHLRKVANANLVNCRNQRNQVSVDLAMQFDSPKCTTWCSDIIWGLEHAHKVLDQLEKVGNVELLKFGSGQRGFWDILVNQNNWDSDET